MDSLNIIRKFVKSVIGLSLIVFPIMKIFDVNDKLERIKQLKEKENERTYRFPRPSTPCAR